MTLTRTLSALALAAMTGFSMSACAQDSHEAHHPAGGAPQASAPPPPAPKQAAPEAAMPGGMMGGDMMKGGMMGGNMMGMMNMMKMCPMMSQSDTAMPGMEMADHVEGRIAYLRAELKITDAQSKAWNDFAQSLRDQAKKVGDMRGMMGNQDGQTAVQRLDQQEKWYAARLDGIRSLKGSTARLYAVLSDDQKKTADQVLLPHLGMMPMNMMAMMGQSGMGGSQGMSGNMMGGSKP